MAKDLKSYNNQSMKDKFSDYSAAPSEELWGKVADALDEKKDRKLIPIWWALGISACIAIFLLIDYTSTEINSVEQDIVTSDNQDNEIKKTAVNGQNKDLLTEQKELVNGNVAESDDRINNELITQESTNSRANSSITVGSKAQDEVVNSNKGNEPQLIVEEDIEKIDLPEFPLELDLDTNLVAHIEPMDFDWDDFKNSQTSWELSARMDQLALAAQTINFGGEKFESTRQNDPGVVIPSAPAFSEPLPVMRVNPPQRLLITGCLNIKKFSFGLSIGIEKWRMSTYTANQTILLESANIYTLSLPVELAYTWFDKSRFRIRSGIHVSNSFFLGKTMKTEEIASNFITMEAAMQSEKTNVFRDYRLSTGINSTVQYFLNERWFLRVDSYAGIVLRNYKRDSHLRNAKKSYLGFGGGIGLSF